MINNYELALGILKTLEEWSDKLKAFIFDNYNNPLLWCGILGVAFIFFATMFSSLNKD